MRFSGARPRSIEEVVERHLCCGCGVCEYLEPATVTMVNITSRGLRPVVSAGSTTSGSTLEACPGAGLRHSFDRDDQNLVSGLTDSWGPVRTVWEGYATDPEIRYAGSSAGAASVIALHCLEAEGMGGVLHTGARPDVPYLNQTVFSTTRAELLAATGSRYAPASPCDGLDQIEHGDEPAVFIGKPCDVAGVAAARRITPALDVKVGLTIAIFCAGTPSTEGTLAMIRAMGIADPAAVREVRYRGNGWPGLATAETDSARHTLTYAESWGGVLQKHRQWRCYVCADHTGEFGDVAVGDPWHQQPDGNDPGRSLIVARTERGERIVRNAIAAGALTAWSVEPDLLPRSQPNLEKTRGAVWARILVTRALGASGPRYVGLPTFGAWRRNLSTREKISSIGGTVRRVFTKRLRDPARITPADIHDAIPNDR